MALTYGFFNSLKGDRKYDAEQMSSIFDGILKDGIIPSYGQLFVVKTANNGMQITVGTGRAWFNHTWTLNDSIMVLNVPQSDITRPRYDTVVLEVNHEQMVRANYIKVVQGESAVNPLKPILVNTDKVKQYPLAHILVPAAATQIKAENIENMVGRSPTVFATGILETVAIDDLWSQWEGEWHTWFEAIKLQLSGDIVTNLQYQIDQKVDISDKASKTEATTGINNTKWMTPLRVREAIEGNNDINVGDLRTTLSYRNINSYCDVKFNLEAYTNYTVCTENYVVGISFIDNNPDSINVSDKTYDEYLNIARKSDLYTKTYKINSDVNSNIVSVDGILGSIPESNDTIILITNGSFKRIKISNDCQYTVLNTYTSTFPTSNISSNTYSTLGSKGFIYWTYSHELWYARYDDTALRKYVYSASASTVDYVNTIIDDIYAVHITASVSSTEIRINQIYIDMYSGTITTPAYRTFSISNYAINMQHYITGSSDQIHNLTFINVPISNDRIARIVMTGYDTFASNTVEYFPFEVGTDINPYGMYSVSSNHIQKYTSDGSFTIYSLNTIYDVNSFTSFKMLKDYVLFYYNSAGIYIITNLQAQPLGIMSPSIPELSRSTFADYKTFRTSILMNIPKLIGPNSNEIIGGSDALIYRLNIEKSSRIVMV